MSEQMDKMESNTAKEDRIFNPSFIASIITNN